MKVIYKYHLELNDRVQYIPQFRQAQIVLVAVQHGRITLWIEFDPSTEGIDAIERRFRIYATGQAIPRDHKHVGSVLLGEFVWHVYEVL